MKKIKAKFDIPKTINGKNIVIKIPSKIDYLGAVEAFLKDLGYKIKEEKTIDFMPDGIYWFVKRKRSKDSILVSYHDKEIWMQFHLHSEKTEQVIKLSKNYFYYKEKE